MYKRLYSEHLQLERAFGLLRHLVAESHGQERTAKILSWAEEKQKLQNIVESLKMVVGQLKQELKEAQDQNELLEFRFLELEQCQFKVTEDEQLREKGVNTDSCIENQDILDFDDVIKKCEATNTK
ncbi:janus kinase and microtubule-interacting protein 1-like, partial [Limulus polyphemus]|uniref:Janus kinase and microtubule-interacting protein 1-like n=1 Tax=Limulus polyphemus TaxID=6850 RepID=A0ABM1TQ46_LIMPO